ncbi:hypothetical protein [Listeria fleischmannii]|uniref:Uncharacterized protein n=1 Tax=Listeria fleischmannii FSL S10-1203 TaxID=1265822 RepID=W7DLX2_9LIST|nr:hypothetical protein [Listeria fleischmannii]EUJ48691.1 hypothetical protein MCOL2_17137 [Listeria fleischmannii FSL S10-1203]
MKTIEFVNAAKLQDFLEIHKRRYDRQHEKDDEVVYDVTFDTIMEQLTSEMSELENRGYVSIELDDHGLVTSYLSVELVESIENVLIVDFVCFPFYLQNNPKKIKVEDLKQ